MKLRDELGNLFTRTGKDVWRLVAYADEPTVAFKNLETGDLEAGSISSKNVKDFKKLVIEVKK